MRKLIYLSIVGFFISPAVAQENARVSAAIQKLETEFSKMGVGVQFPNILKQLVVLKNEKSPKLKKYLNEIPALSRTQKHFAQKSNFNDADFYDFLKRIGVDVSPADSLRLTREIYLDWSRVAELGIFLLNNLKPEAYPDFIEKNKTELLKSGPTSVVFPLDVYCQSKIQLGQAQACINLILPLKNKIKSPAIDLILANTYLAMAKISLAKALLPSILVVQDKKCVSAEPAVSWATYFGAQLYRIEGNLAQSLSCLAALSKDKDPHANFYYNLEMGKTSRFESPEKAQQYFAAAEAHPLTSRESYLFILVEIERLKDAILNQNTQDADRLKKSILSKLSGTRLFPMKQFITNLGPKLQKPTSFEELDFNRIFGRKSL